MYCCYANNRFLSFSSHLVEFQVYTYPSLDIADTVWAVRPNQYHFTSNTTAYVSDSQLESACKDRLAEPHLGFPQNIFAVLDV